MSHDERWVHTGPEFPLEEPDRPFSHLLFDRLKEHGDKVLLVDGPSGAQVTASQVLAHSVGVALELQAMGVRPGDRVCAGLDNGPHVAYVLLGTFYVGAVYAPFNPDLHQSDLSKLLSELRPRVALCCARAGAKVVAALGAGGGALVLTEAWRPLRRAPPAAAVAAFRPSAAPRPDHAFCIMCSSGTTGPPKGAVLSHRIWHYFAQFVQLLDAHIPEAPSLRRLRFSMTPPEERHRDVTLQVSPNFWMSGFASHMFSLLGGVPLVIYRHFDVDALLAGVQKYRVTFFFLAPTHISAIAKHPEGAVERYDLSSVRDLGYGGAALSWELHELAERRLGRRITQFYGQTECLQAILPEPDNKPHSVGVVAPNAQLKVVDVETGKILGPNQEGELCVKTKLRFSGYYNNPQATKETVDEDGWIHSGDVAYFDEDGYFYILDRYKELIKYRGNHIAPADMEKVLSAHPGVKDAAVVGIEHDDDQEHPVGFVVRQGGRHVTAQELRQLLAEKLPAYKQLHGGLHFVQEIPRTASGKVQRRLLRQRARALRSKL